MQIFFKNDGIAAVRLHPRGLLRAVCVLLAACLLTAAAPLAVSAAAMGDVNADNSVNASDALLALQSSVGLRVLTAEEFDRADVDGNGSVNASDALLMLQYSVGLIHSFPADTDAVSIPWSPENQAVLQSADAFLLRGRAPYRRWPPPIPRNTTCGLIPLCCISSRSPRRKAWWIAGRIPAGI